MDFHKPSIRVLYRWWCRLFLITLIPCLLTTLIFAVPGVVWTALMAVWLLVFIVMFSWYYPLKYKKLSYAITPEMVIVRSGVIYTRTRYLYISNIQYVSMDTSVVEAVFGISTAFLRTAGASLRINGLDSTGVKYVKTALALYFAKEKGAGKNG